MYTNPITNGTSQIVYTQSACAAPKKSVEIQEEETAGRITDQDAYIHVF